MQLLKEIVQRKATPSQNELDETDLFFNSMAKIVKKLPRYEQVHLRMQISSLVGNAELRNISNESRQTNDSSRPSSSSSTIFPETMVSPATNETLNYQGEMYESSTRPSTSCTDVSEIVLPPAAIQKCILTLDDQGHIFYNM